jgi:hypothetical protein
LTHFEPPFFQHQTFALPHYGCRNQEIIVISSSPQGRLFLRWLMALRPPPAPLRYVRFQALRVKGRFAVWADGNFVVVQSLAATDRLFCDCCILPADQHFISLFGFPRGIEWLIFVVANS